MRRSCYFFSPSISLSLSSLYTSHFISLHYYAFTFSILCFALFLNLSALSLSPLSAFFFFLVSFSISLCTPTRSDIDCYARRIAPYTLTPCCKSFIDNVEVFLREACIISEFGCSLCSCLGAGPVLQFYCCCSAVALCLGWVQGRRLAGRRDYSANTQTECRTGIERTGVSI